MTTSQKEEILKKVGFPVRELPQILAYNEVESIRAVPIPNRKAIYREDTGEILALPSNKYNLIPHSQVVESVFDAFDKEGIEYNPVRVELVAKGAHLYMHLRTPEIFTIGDKGDEVQMETIIRNSYDGTESFGMELGGNRLVCTNGMRAYRRDFIVTKKHYTFNTQDVIQRFIDQVKKFKEIFLPFLQNCARLEITGQEAIEFIGALQIAQKYQKAAVEHWSEERKVLGANYWALYNTLTYVASHVAKSYMTRRDMEIRTFRALNAKVSAWV